MSLLIALKDWLEDAESGKPSNAVKTRGLCSYVGISNAVTVDLAAQFLSDKSLTCTIYPFGADDYDERQLNKTMHLCPKRLAWVKKTIAKLESENE